METQLHPQEKKKKAQQHSWTLRHTHSSGSQQHTTIDDLEQDRSINPGTSEFQRVVYLWKDHLLPIKASVVVTIQCKQARIGPVKKLQNNTRTAANRHYSSFLRRLRPGAVPYLLDGVHLKQELQHHCRSICGWLLYSSVCIPNYESSRQSHRCLR